MSVMGSIYNANMVTDGDGERDMDGSKGREMDIL